MNSRPTRRTLRAAGAALLTAAVVATTLTPTGGRGLVSADDAPIEIGSDTLTGAASAYRPINPIRVLDTRKDDGTARLWVESAISIDPVTDTGVAEAAGVDPADITAVVVNATMINVGNIGFEDGGAPGFGTIWPTGSKRLATSTNNVEFRGHTIPNLAIAPLGLERKISFFSSTTSDLAIDVLGVFVKSEATTAGRFEPLGPERAFDTRRTDTADFSEGETREVDLTGVGVPADATAVVMNVTAIRSKGPGFYRVWSAGDPAPTHSSVNVLGVDYQAGNQVISGVDSGVVNVFTNVGGGLTIDVTGYFTGDSGDPTTDGLYVPFTPGRLLDSRRDSGPTSLTSGERLAGGTTVELDMSNLLDIPDVDAKAVAFNLTAVRADARGFVKVFPAGTDEPDTSSINFTTGGQTVPNHAITSLSSDGAIEVAASVGTNFLIDATGYFLAPDAPVPAGETAAGKTIDPGEFVPTALAGSAPTDGPYDFLFDRGRYTSQGFRPSPTIKAAWPNCAVIRYAINVDLAENDAQIEALVTSIEEMELYTGIDFQFAGVTSSGMNIDEPILLPESFTVDLQQRESIDQTPAPYKYLPADDNGADSVSLVIGFSNNDDTVELRSPGVIGVGGSLRTGEDSSGRAEALRGFAVIDLVELYRDGADGSETLANIKATTTHELGHMMGLGHVSDFDPRSGAPSTLFQGLGPGAAGWPAATVRDQLMYPSLNPVAGTEMDLGDQRGLWELYGAPFCPSKQSKPDDGGAPSIDWTDVEVFKPVDDFG